MPHRPDSAEPKESLPGDRAPGEELIAPPGDGPDVPLAEVRASVEALLYAAGEPLTPRELKRALPEAKDLVVAALKELVASYQADGRGLTIAEVAGGFQIVTRPEFHERVSRLFDAKRPARLSIQALETLAVIAYRQPITVPEIMELRGINSAGVVRTLLEKKLIRIMGRRNVVGRPLLYGTTKGFLLRFGLKNLKELPQLQDMSEVFGEEVAQQLEGLEDVLPPPSAEDILPLEDGDMTAEGGSPSEPNESGEDSTPSLSEPDS